MLVITTGAKGWWWWRWRWPGGGGGGGCKNRLGTFDGGMESGGGLEPAKLLDGGGIVFRLR